MKTFLLLSVLSVSIAFSSAFAETAPKIATATGKKVHFIKPHDKEIVPTTFQVEFGVNDMKLAKAGDLKPGTGHHHLIVDGTPVAAGQVVPKNETHLHFGDASTTTSLSLKPGKHTLTLQFADGLHKSLGEDFATTISVEVK